MMKKVIPFKLKEDEQNRPTVFGRSNIDIKRITTFMIGKKNEKTRVMPDNEQEKEKTSLKKTPSSSSFIIPFVLLIPHSPLSDSKSFSSFHNYNLSVV
jgi:hypothetical protein